MPVMLDYKMLVSYSGIVVYMYTIMVGVFVGKGSGASQKQK